MNESEGDSQKSSNSPGYTNAMNSPFKTPLSAKGGRANKSRASKEGKSCPPTPISNAGQKFSQLTFHLSTLCSNCNLLLVVPQLIVSYDMQVPLLHLLLLVAVVMTVP